MLSISLREPYQQSDASAGAAPTRILVLRKDHREKLHLMSKLVIALILVAALLLGGLVGLLRGRRDPMGSPEVLERAKRRNRELDAQETRED